MQFAFRCNAKRFAIMILVCFLFFPFVQFLDVLTSFLGTFYHLLPRKCVAKIGLISFDTLKKVP